MVQVVDKNGNIVNNYKYDEWGNILESNETISNPFKYAGEIYDQETGLYYLRARYYDPALGRFINEDTYEGQVTDPFSLNLYSYCYNNSLIYTDPSGHEAIVVSGGLYRVGSGYKYNFIEPALKWINEMRNRNAVFYIGNESIAWIIADSGWSNDDWIAFETAVSGLNVNIIRVGSTESLIDYINNKTGGNSRASDLITKFTVFSHGWSGTMSLGYDYTDTYNTDLNFNTTDISQINGSAFDNPASWFGSCNLGTGGVDSFGQAWVKQVGGTTWAFEGNTEYAHIMYPSGYSKFKPWHWGTRSKIIKARKKYGFSITGSYRYPGATKGAREVMFTK